MRSVEGSVFLKRLKRISEDYTGAIDGCTPFLCRYAGTDTLSKAIRGEARDYIWDSISVDVAREIKIAILMYVKYMYVNNSPKSIYGINNVNLLRNMIKSEGKPIIRVSIRGILINPILFLKEKYKCEGDSNHHFETDDSIYIKHLGATISGCVLRGRFDLRTCSYYCY